MIGDDGLKSVNDTEFDEKVEGLTLFVGRGLKLSVWLAGAKNLFHHAD